MRRFIRWVLLVVAVAILYGVLIKPEVTVKLSNTDDVTTVYLNGRKVATSSYGESEKTISLGRLKKSDRIRIEVTNFFFGYTWGIDVSAQDGGVHDFAGRVGVFGANNNDYSRVGLVHRVVVNGHGRLCSSMSVRPKGPPRRVNGDC